MPRITPLPTETQIRFAPWLEWAFLALGERAIAGARRNNPSVVDFLRTVGQGSNGDETAWCSAFVNWCVVQAGISGTGNALARSWLKWGDQALIRPVFGCVTVLRRSDPHHWGGHVGFYVGEEGDDLVLLGGNQKPSKVTIAAYPKARLLGFRWPAGMAQPLA